MAGVIRPGPPGDPWLLELLTALAEPLVSTSANRVGQAPPVRFDQVPLSALEPDLAVDRGPCPGGTPSTLVSLLEDPPRVLRQGDWRLGS